MSNAKQTIVAAVKTKDTDVPKPASRMRSSSFAAMVSDLEVGDSASRVHRINPDMTLEEVAENMSEMKDMMRNNAAPAVKAARTRTGGAYSIEVGDMVMPGGRMYLVVVVTRNE